MNAFKDGDNGEQDWSSDEGSTAYFAEPGAGTSWTASSLMGGFGLGAAGAGSQQTNSGPTASSSKAKTASSSGGSKAKKTGSKDKDDEKKRRSSKACDACRRAKCKCLRLPDEQGNETGPCTNCTANGLECTFLGASKKRGPPKGYIEAIENRMHRMEALLGGLLNNDDPRAQALLEELVGDIEARELLSRDLQVAVRTGKDKPPLLKSWQRDNVKSEDVDVALAGQSSTKSGKRRKEATASTEAGLPDKSDLRKGPWIPDDDLTVVNSSTAMSPVSNPSGTFISPIAMDFDPAATGGEPQGSYAAGTALWAASSGTSSNTAAMFATSPRNQRRRLSQSESDHHKSGQTNGDPNQRVNLFALQQRAGNVPAPQTILHTGSAYYNLTSNASAGSPSVASSSAKSPGVDGQGASPTLAQAATQGQEGPLSELADVVGQLSLDEHQEVRYHGRSSGLYLISKSARYKDFFWRFPKAGDWPPAEDQQRIPVLTEEELIAATHADSVLPDKRTSDHLMELYWIYVHPHIPLLYRSLFVRQYRNTVHPGETSAQGQQPAQAVGGKVPSMLLLAVYALAARYSNTGGQRKEGVFWKAGEEYAQKAKDLLHADFGYSRLSTIQALLLLAYREAGIGAMAQSWLYTGMAVRMAQDMGLFRDVDKWFLPVNTFNYEEKQTRKRVWWTAIVMDKYISAYIGRPMAIFERDYDVALPAEEEPDEHDIWRPIRPDGTDWEEQPVMFDESEPSLNEVRRFPHGVKSNSISCFNHSATLSVLFSRIIANLYAIRVRVIGQNSQTLLAHLDQALANWYIHLPPHLQYNTASKRVPPPHVLALHCQFFAALILLHRPFIPAQGADKVRSAFPSHSICTTAAIAISNIVSLYSKTYTLRQAIPFLTYYIFSSAIMHVYNSTYDESLAETAKAHLVKCMRALKEMELTWGGASRQWELLLGIVDLRDVDPDLVDKIEEEGKGRKRAAEDQNVYNSSGDVTPSGATTSRSEFRRLPTFHTRPSFSSSTRPTFASANLGQTTAKSNASSKQRRSNPKSVARSTSISRSHDSPYEARPSAKAATSSTAVPFQDFTFVSPVPSSAELPSISPNNGGDVQAQQSTNLITDFLSYSPGQNPSPAFSSINLANFSPPPAAPAALSISSDQQHSFNILGLNSSNFDFPALTVPNLSGTATGTQPAADLFSGFGAASPQTGSTAPAYPGIADFLMDPLWQTLQEQQAQNLRSQGDQSITSPQGQGHSDVQAQPGAFFGVPFSADPSTEDWARYLTQAMPNSEMPH